MVLARHVHEGPTAVMAWPLLIRRLCIDVAMDKTGGILAAKRREAMEKLYTTEEVAEILKVSPRTIRREREDANLNFIRIRGQIRYREEDIRKYLAENSWDEQVKLGAE